MSSTPTPAAAAASSAAGESTTIELQPVGAAIVKVTTAATDDEFPPPAAQSLGCGGILVLLLLSPFLLVLFLLVALLWLFLLPFRSCMHNSSDLRLQPQHDLSALSGGGLPGAYFQSARGSWLFYRRWMPASASGATPKAVIYLAHGFGEHVSRPGYILLAQKLNAAGIALFALDHQGHGRSSGDRAFYARMEHVVEEFMEFSRMQADGIAADTPRFWMGHSMGGLIALSAAVRSLQPSYSALRSSAFRGCILSSPCLAIDPKLATPPLKMAATVLSEVLPKLVLEGIPPETLSRNKQAVEAYTKDPFNWHGGARARVGQQMLAEMSLTLSQLHTFTLPLLLLHGTKDAIVPTFASTLVYNGVKSADKTFRKYQDAYHEIAEDETDGVNELWLGDIVAWVQAHLQAEGETKAEV
jgi:acylglycerol lipase